jgi:hypothetical protein
MESNPANPVIVTAMIHSSEHGDGELAGDWSIIASFNNFAGDKTKQMSYCRPVINNLNLLLTNALLTSAAVGF